MTRTLVRPDEPARLEAPRAAGGRARRRRAAAFAGAALAVTLFAAAPQAAPLAPYALLIAMLAWRPRGLFGRREDDA